MVTRNECLGARGLTCLLSLGLLWGCGGRTLELTQSERESAGSTSGATSGATSGQSANATSGTGGSSTASVATTGFATATGATTGSVGTVTTGGPTLPPFVLLGAPMVVTPTEDSFVVNVALSVGNPLNLVLEVWDEAERDWRVFADPDNPAFDLAEWMVGDLEPGRKYEYRVRALDGAFDEVLYTGSANTQRAAGESFSFALVTDTHISPRELDPGETDTIDFGETTLTAVAPEMLAFDPDFMVNLGDMLDFHLFGFNDPPPDGSWTRLAYLNYRRLLGDTLGHVAHFPVIGNWDGENGNFTPEQVAYSREQRMLYAPAPGPGTYPEGGNADEDYYAFTWGDALFVVLNVMTYTPTAHLLSSDPGVPDDWTLGPEQLEFLEETLAAATSPWRFLLIHHAVGGAAADLPNSAYGRGGGQAAYVGEQAYVHQLMLEHGVQIFFYGHDHVFTDIVVDDIHYTLPGSAGAPWKFEGYETGYTQYWTESGHGRVHVSPDSVTVEFIAEGGELLYDYTLE